MISSRFRSISFIPFACIFLSGVTSLTYELIWIRQLKLLFGGTLYAISAVLCAFMTGLALGAWGAGKLLNRPGLAAVHRVRLYGWLEGGIGLYGFIFPLLAQGLGSAYPLLADLAGTGGSLHLLQFVIATGIMLPATLLMGATLPVIGGWSISDRSLIFSNLSLLYSLNTFGAVAGCLYTQFWAVPQWGIHGTQFSVVALNLLIFFLCYFWSPAEAEAPFQSTQKPSSRTSLQEEEQPTRSLSLLLLFLFAYSGMVALASEILWTRILIFPLGSSLYSFTIILATFLFGIALGSLVAKKLLGQSRWITKFILLEAGIGLVCLVTFPGLDQLTQITLKTDHLFYDIDSSSWRTLGMRSLVAFGLMFLPTLGFGLIFPLANHIHFSLFGDVSRTLGNSYAVNTLGAILGTVLAPFVLIPIWGIQQSLFVLYVGLILLSAGAWVLHSVQNGKPWILGFATTGIIIIGAYILLTPGQAAHHLGDHNLARVEINTTRDNLKLLDYKEGNFSTLSVIEDKTSGARTLYIDGFSTATASESIGGSAYMQAMGWVPMILHPNPRRALVMCFGTGNTLGTVARFPQVEVDGVEIDRNVLTLADWFEPWNHKVLGRSNVRMHIQDGRNFIQWTGSTYDVITLEPMSPVQAGVNNLYSREFYEHARARLNPKGLMMQWLPLHLVSPEDAWAIIKTFQEVFPHTTVWNSFLTRIVLLVGSEEPITLNPETFDRRMAATEVRQMAGEIGIFSFVDLLDFYLTDGESLEPFLKSARTITDDRPYLEYSAVNLVPPLKRETDETFLNLLRHRVDRMPTMQGETPDEREYFSEGQALRTAQRLSVFAQRYRGPGLELFQKKRYREGLHKVRGYLNSIGKEYIQLENNGWKAEARP